MTLKLFLVIFLLIIDFSYIQNQPHSFKTFISWPKNAKMQGMKEMRATFTGEHLRNIRDFMVVKEDKDAFVKKLTQVVDSNEEQRQTNRYKREAVSKDVSISPSVEALKPTADSKEVQKVKRQTSDNGNRLKNLINLPIKLNVLANVLSQLNSGVLDSNQKSLGANAIPGKDNTVSNLANGALDVNAVVNLLSDIDVTKPGSAGSDGGKGAVGGVLQSLLGGGGKGEAGEKGSGLLGNLLGGDGDGSGLLGGVLGNTLGDLLQTLLGGDGLVGNLLEGLDGKGLVAEILDNLLSGVVDLVDKLLDLVNGLLQALLQADPKTSTAHHATGASNAASKVSHDQGNNSTALSLINAPIRLNALINVLSSLKQELRPQAKPSAGNQEDKIQGNNNKASSLINLPVNLDVGINALSSLQQTQAESPNAYSKGVHPAGSLLSGSSSPGPSTSTNSGGLVNVAPDVNLNLNVLSEVTDLLGENAGSATGGSQQGSNPNEICFDVPINQAATSKTGNNNRGSSVVNLQPTINLDLNLLSRSQQSGSFKGPTQRVCIIRPTKPTAAMSTSPSIVKPMTSASMPFTTNDICFDILVDQSGNVVSGNNNQLTSLINLDANIDAAVNLLSNVQQSNALAGFKVKRICLPRQLNTSPSLNLPPTPPATRTPTEERCFKRTCTRWRQFVDTKCTNTANEYPKLTYTRDI